MELKSKTEETAELIVRNCECFSFVAEAVAQIRKAEVVSFDFLGSQQSFKGGTFLGPLARDVRRSWRVLRGVKTLFIEDDFQSFSLFLGERRQGWHPWILFRCEDL